MKKVIFLIIALLLVSQIYAQKDIEIEKFRELERKIHDP